MECDFPNCDLARTGCPCRNFSRGFTDKATAWDAISAKNARIEALEAALDEMTRRRDEWRKKAEGFDAVRLALREKVGTPWPPNMSRLLWAGIAADEKKRADDAEAALLAADELARALDAYNRAGAGPLTGWQDVQDALAAYRRATVIETLEERT